MIKVKSFRAFYNYEENLAKEIELFFKEQQISRQNIVDIKFTTSDDYLYYMIVWEEQLGKSRDKKTNYCRKR